MLLAYSGLERLTADVTSIVLVLVNVVAKFAYEGPAVHTVCSLLTVSGAELGIVLNGEFLTALHTLAGITAGEVPVVVAGCGALIAFNLSAKSTYSVVAAVLCAGRIGILLNVPLVNGEVVDLYLFSCTAAVSTAYLHKTVSLCLAVCLGNYFFFTPEGVSLGIDFGCLGVIVITVCALKYSNSGSAAGSCYKFGMPENILLILVDALFTKITYVVFVLVSVVGENSVTKVALVVLVYVYVHADGSAADVTRIVIILVNAYAELGSAEVTVVIGVGVRTLGSHRLANVTLVVLICISACGKISSTKVALVIVVTVPALGESSGANVTLVIVIRVLALREYLLAKITLMILTLILTLGHRFLAKITIMIIVFVCMVGAFNDFNVSHAAKSIYHLVKTACQLIQALLELV